VSITVQLHIVGKSRRFWHFRCNS